MLQQREMEDQRHRRWITGNTLGGVVWSSVDYGAGDEQDQNAIDSDGRSVVRGLRVRGQTV